MNQSSANGGSNWTMLFNLFKKRMSPDEAGDSILSELKKFDKMNLWWEALSLSAVSGLPLESTKAEILYLDCFAVYIALKFNHSHGWKQNGTKIFEKVLQGCAVYAATTLAGKVNATMEEVKKVGAEIDKRFSVYFPIFENSCDTLTDIGTAFAKFCQVDGSPVLIRAGGDLFNVRGFKLTKFTREHSVYTERHATASGS
jgi:hypothetical protein